MLDIKLDKITHDIDLSTFDLQLIDELDQLEQKLKIVLKFFFAEWFLDTTVGIKFIESVYVSNPNLTLIDSLFKTAILEVKDVNELTAYDSIYNKTSRSFSLTFTVKSTFGELSTTQEVSL